MVACTAYENSDRVQARLCPPVGQGPGERLES